MATGKPKVLEEMPIADLEAQRGNYEQVNVTAKRRNGKGQLMTVYANMIKTIDEVILLDGFLKTNAGGGTYRIEVRDPNNKASYLVPPFKIHIEGPPRPPRHLGSAAHTNPYAGIPLTPHYPDLGMEHVPPPMLQGPLIPTTSTGSPQVQHQVALGNPHAPPPPKWAAGLRPEERGGYVHNPYMYGYQRPAPAPGASVPSDQVALRQVQDEKARSERMLAKMEERNKALEDKVTNLLDELKNTREEARERAHAAEMRALREEMKQAISVKSAPAEKSTMEQLALLAPFVPIFTEMVKGNSNSNNKALELQTAGLNNLMNATLQQANKKDPTTELIGKLLPMALPLFKDVMEQKSPAAQAALFNSMAENSLNSIAMMAQLIEAFANSGPDQPWYMEPVREALNGLVGLSAAYMQGQGGLPGQMTPSPLSPNLSPNASQPQPAQASTYGVYEPAAEEAHEAHEAHVVGEPTPRSTPTATEDVEDAEIVEPPPQAPTPIEGSHAAQAVSGITPQQQIMLNMLPADFQTPEWRVIVLRLHQSNDAEDVATLIFGHLTNCLNFGLLPKPMHDLQTDPAAALARCLGPLPVMQTKPQFGQTVLKKVIEFLIEDGYVHQPPPMAQVQAQPEPVSEPAQATG